MTDGSQKESKGDRLSIAVTREEKQAAERVAAVRRTSVSELLWERVIPGILEEDARIDGLLEGGGKAA